MTNELERLDALRRSGALTDEEFAAQKAKLLAAGPATKPPRAVGKMSVLAIVAFVLSFILGPIGSLLGIVAVVLIATSRGRLRGLAFGISAICTGIFAWGILAAIAIPSFMNYIKRAKSAEVAMTLETIDNAALMYFQAEHTGADGQIRTGLLPPSVDWTPAIPCCAQNPEQRKCDAEANAAAFANSPTWSALGFSVSSGFYYQYRFVVEGNQFAIQARGDLDCDGKYSLFEHRYTVDSDGAVRTAPSILETEPLE